MSQTANSARGRKEAEVSAAEPAAGQIQSVRLSASGHLPTWRGRASNRLEPLDTTTSSGLNVDGRTTIYTNTQRDQAEIVDQMRTEMQCMQADMRAEMRREMQSLRQELEAKNQQIQELVRHVSQLKAEPEPEPELEPEPEPERPSTEAMLLQMLENGEEPCEPSRNGIFATFQPFAFPTEADTGKGKQAKTEALLDEHSAQVPAREEMEADRDLNQQPGIQSIAYKPLGSALDRMQDLPDTATQVAEKEPPLMRELVQELLDTVMVERMGLPEMEKSDFREVAQELLGSALDRMQDLPETATQMAEKEPPVMRELVQELLDTVMVERMDWTPSCTSEALNAVHQYEEGVDAVDVRAVVGELLDVAIERMCILSEEPCLLTTTSSSNALARTDLSENAEDTDPQHAAAQPASQADDEADEPGCTGDGTTLQIDREVDVKLVAPAMEHIGLPQDTAKTVAESDDDVDAAPTTPAAHELTVSDSSISMSNANSDLVVAVEVAPAVNNELPDNLGLLHVEAVTKQMVKKTVQLS